MPPVCSPGTRLRGWSGSPTSQNRHESAGTLDYWSLKHRQRSIRLGRMCHRPELRPVPWTRLAPPITPPEIRRWRTELCGVSQSRLAAELGIGRRTLGAYERGELPIPALLPWALFGLLKPLRGKVRLEARRARANEARRARRALARARRDAQRAVQQRQVEQRRARRSRLKIFGQILRRGGSPTQGEMAQLRELELIRRARAGSPTEVDRRRERA